MCPSTEPASTRNAPAPAAGLDPRDPADPLYQWVSKSLERAIADGEHPIGEKLPTETELCYRYGVSRHTVREAVRRLSDLGMVRSKAGVGTIVTSNLPPVVLAYRSTSDNDLLGQPRDTTHRDYESSELVAIENPAAQLIGSEPGTKWHRLVCTRRTDDGDVPLCRLDHYVEPEIAARVEWPTFDRNMTVRQLIRRDTGIQSDRIDVRISAHTVNQQEAELLEVSPGSSTLLMVRRMFDDKGLNFVSVVSVHPEHRFALDLQFHTETGT